MNVDLASMADRIEKMGRANWTYGNRAKLAAELRALAARLPGDVEQDAARYRLLRSKAHQKTAYDVYGDGGLWTIGIHSNDNRLSLDDVIDAQLPATPTASPAAGIGGKL